MSVGVVKRYPAYEANEIRHGEVMYYKNAVHGSNQTCLDGPDSNAMVRGWWTTYQMV